MVVVVPAIPEPELRPVVVLPNPDDGVAVGYVVVVVVAAGAGAGAAGGGVGGVDGCGFRLDAAELV